MGSSCRSGSQKPSITPYSQRILPGGSHLDLMKKPLDSKKYLYTFLTTSVIFFTAIIISNWFGQKKIENIRTIQDQIATDILSSEVQTSLLREFSCKEVGGTALSQELGNLGDKLSATQDIRGADDPQVIALKKYYSLLQIKDFLLMRQVSQKCGTKYGFVLYFYGKDCTDCQRQGYVLTKLREDYPQLRVYSFDYNLDISAVKTLVSINKIGPNLPALLVEDETSYGFQSTIDLEKAIPQVAVWKKENEAKAKASSTPTTKVQ